MSTAPAHALALTQLLGAELLTTPDPTAPEGALFGVSLFPYLLFLYFLGREENRCPPRAFFGFQFLLVFVFASIPAAIISQICYNVTLSDCDWAHGLAESLLTITNLLIVTGFRDGLRSPPGQPQPRGDPPTPPPTPPLPPPPTPTPPLLLRSSLLPSLGLLLLTAGVGVPLEGDFLGLGVHSPFLGGVGDLPDGWARLLLGGAEPLNALSMPTWLIHVASLVEWLAAMGLVWRYAGVTGNERWKGLTWGMLPLHTSGICACTYHLFYNNPAIANLVALQALLTCIGNSTAAWAAYRIAVSNGWEPKLPALPAMANLFNAPEPETATDAAFAAKAAPTPTPNPNPNPSPNRNPNPNPSPYPNSSPSPNPDLNQKPAATPVGGRLGLVGFEDLADAWAEDSDARFVGKLLLGCAVGSYAVKYGGLHLQPPAEALPAVALGVIFIPSLLNALKWYRRSKDGSFDALL